MIQKFIRYLNNIIHNVYFNDIYNNVEQKENIKKNISNIFTGFINNNIDNKIYYHILNQINVIIKNEIKYYISNKINDNEQFIVLFNDFKNLFNQSIILNNLFTNMFDKISILNDYNVSIMNQYKPSSLFVYNWKIMVLYKYKQNINNYIIYNIYNNNIIYNENIQTILYILKTHYINEYNNIYNFLLEYGKKFYSNNFEEIINNKIDLYEYIQNYKYSVKIEIDINDNYPILEKYNLEKFIVKLYFKHSDIITNLYNLFISKVLDDFDNISNIEKLKEIDKYLFQFMQENIYKSLIECFVDKIIEHNKDMNVFKKYLSVYKRCKQLYHLHTFKNYIEPIINIKFSSIKDEHNFEESLVILIVEDIKQKVVSEYLKLLIFSNKELFMTYYINYLCKRILNNKYDISIEHKYYNNMVEYELENIYKVEIILNDIIFSKSINSLFDFTKTNMLIGRKEIWPIKTKEKIPKSFESEYNIIKNTYESAFENRKLYINTDLLRCDIIFNGYTFNVKGYMVDILLMFNNNNEINKKEIKSDLKKFIKLGLFKETNDTYYINDNFTFKKKHIKIN